MRTPDNNAAPSAVSDSERTFYRYRFENCEFDAASAALSVNGQRVSLEPRPLRLLAELLHHVNEVISKEELADSVWDGRPTVDNVFANAITKLRKALGEPAAARIVTVPRIGYRLDGPVERIATGRLPNPTFGLQCGQPVPGREGWQLQRPLGSPGQGSAWLARHTKLKDECRVFKFAHDAEQLRRLKREFTLFRVLRSILGERHDIARLLDCNFGEAPYFLECEYGGTDLLQWADSESAPLRALSFAERLALFLQIARAVAAAHGAGVLHKDLKPANVLISGRPQQWQVKLTDFGSGRAIDPERLRNLGLTALGMTLSLDVVADDLSGTAIYLAPELLAGSAASVQSDLYALGILLYQLVVGDLRKPLSTGWPRDISDAMVSDDIAAATDGDPAARLGSAAELVDRISTLEARHQAAWQRAAAEQKAAAAEALLQRSRARRPWVVGLVGSALLGLAASLWFQSEAASALARSRVDAARAKALNDFLNQDVLAAANVIRTGSNKPASMVEVLRQSSQRAAQRFKDRPLMESPVRHQLGRVFNKLASTSDADNEFQAAIKLRAAHVPADDAELLAMRFEHVNLVLFMGGSEPERAIAQAGQQLEDAERLAGTARLAVNSELAFLAARARTVVLESHNDYAGALVSAQRAVALARALPELDMDLRWEAFSLLAQMHVHLRQPDLAQQVLADLPREAVEQSRAEAIVITRVAQLVNVGHLRKGQRDKARATLLTALGRLEQARDPSELHIGDVISDLGHIYLGEANFEAARAHYEKALAAFRRALGDEHQYTRITAMNLAGALVELGRFDDALKLHREHRPWFQAHATGGRWVPMDWQMARALIETGHHGDGLRLLSTVPAPGVPTQLKGVPTAFWMAQGWKAVALIRLGRASEGLPVLQATVDHLSADASVEPWSRARLAEILQQERQKASHRTGSPAQTS